MCELERSTENRQALKDAERQLKLSKRKNYYKILGVDKLATQTDIKKAYRKQALLHHPGECTLHTHYNHRAPLVDRHASADQEVREKEEQEFKEVSEAYSVLSDPKKKDRYDSGQDINDLGMGECGYT